MAHVMCEGCPTYSSLSLLWTTYHTPGLRLGVLPTTSLILMKSLQSCTILILGRSVTTLGMSPSLGSSLKHGLPGGQCSVEVSFPSVKVELMSSF